MLYENKYERERFIVTSLPTEVLTKVGQDLSTIASAKVDLTLFMDKRRYAMGDKGKKDKKKHQRQKSRKQEKQKAKKK